MAALQLKHTLAALGIRQTALARHLGLSASAVNQLAGHGAWPKTIARPALKTRIARFLAARGADRQTTARAFARVNEAPSRSRANATGKAAACAADSGPQATPKPRADTRAPLRGDTGTAPITKNHEDIPMLLRKQTLSPDARRHFRIVRDPFTDEMQGAEDVFLTDDIRYVRAALRQTARHGGMLAVVSESGGGKSTLRQDVQDWINTSGEQVVVIEPYVLGMEDNDKRGKTLKAADITGAVIRAVAPGARVPQRAQEAAAQMHAALKASHQMGNRHVLVIEEAHALAVPTLKHLKRFYELQDGFRKLLAIILIGQTELAVKLSEHNPEVREVVQRCEVVTLPPLDNHVEAYLRHKLARAGLDFDALFAPDAAAEIRARLRFAVDQGRGGARQTRTLSLCTPLAINNLVAVALNEAVKIGAPKVTGPIIAAAARTPA